MSNDTSGSLLADTLIELVRRVHIAENMNDVHERILTQKKEEIQKLEFDKKRFGEYVEIRDRTIKELHERIRTLEQNFTTAEKIIEEKDHSIDQLKNQINSAYQGWTSDEKTFKAQARELKRLIKKATVKLEKSK